MTAIPTIRQHLDEKRKRRDEEEKKKRKYRILFVNLPFVIGEDPRFPDEQSMMKHIENVYFEDFKTRKTYAQIKQWLGVSNLG